MSQYSIKDESHLATLDANLKDNLFIGGHSPNAEDALVFEQFHQANTEPNQETHLNLWSWYALVSLFQSEIVNAWKTVVSAKPAAAKKEQPKKQKNVFLPRSKQSNNNLWNLDQTFCPARQNFCFKLLDFLFSGIFFALGRFLLLQKFKKWSIF